MILVDLIKIFLSLMTIACFAFVLYAYVWLPIKDLMLNFIHLLLLFTQLVLKLLLREPIS